MSCLASVFRGWERYTWKNQMEICLEIVVIMEMQYL